MKDRMFIDLGSLLFEYITTDEMGNFIFRCESEEAKKICKNVINEKCMDTIHLYNCDEHILSKIEDFEGEDLIIRKFSCESHLDNYGDGGLRYELPYLAFHRTPSFILFPEHYHSIELYISME